MLLRGRYMQCKRIASKPVKPPNCTRLLLGARSQSSSDAKDKIFAFQGILGRLGIQLPAPDYSKPVSQIYREAAAASIRHDANLLLLSSLTGESLIQGLPSWVPDWSNKHVISEVASWSEERATDLSPPVFGFSEDQSSLTLRGMIIDTINGASLEYPKYTVLRKVANEHANVLSQEQEVHVLQQWFTTFGNGVDMARFFSDFAYNVWARNHDAACLNEHVKHWIQAFSSGMIHSIAQYELVLKPAFWSNDRFQTNEGTQKNMKNKIVSFHTIVRKLLDRKIMFRSQSGELGIGCRSLKKGDSIALFSGCNLPMIIRQHAQHWRIVSPTYLHKAMRDCPAWSLPRSPLQNFTIV
jgi:hypothetical protein